MCEDKNGRKRISTQVIQNTKSSRRVAVLFLADIHVDICATQVRGVKGVGEQTRRSGSLYVLIVDLLMARITILLLPLQKLRATYHRAIIAFQISRMW